MLQEKCTVFIVLECTGEDEFHKETPLAALTSEQAAEAYIQKRKLERIEISNRLEELDQKCVAEVMEHPLYGSSQQTPEQYNEFLEEIEAKYSPEYKRLTHGAYSVGFSDAFRNEKPEYRIVSCPLFEPTILHAADEIQTI